MKRTASSAREWVLFAVAAAALSLTWIPRLHGPIDLRWDAAVYYELGTSLATGRGYRLLNEPGEIEAVTYPPALPALVALHQRFAATSDPVVVGQWLRGTFVVLWIGYLVAAYRLLRTRFTPPLAVLGIALCGLHVSAVWLSDRLYADLPFAALATLFITVAERPVTGRTTLGAWAFGTLAFLTRTVALAVFAGWIGEAVLKRRWKLALVRLALAAVPVLGWQAYIVRVESSEAYRHPPYEYAREPYALYNVPYLQYSRLRDPSFPEQGSLTLGEMAARAVSQARAIPSQFGGAVSASETEWIAAMTRIKASPFRRFVPWIAIPIGLAVLGVVTLVGVCRLLLEGRLTTVLAAAAYVAELCLLPWIFHWPRYLAGIAPILVLAFMTGLGEIAHVVRAFVPAASRIIVPATAGAVLVFQIVVLTSYLQRNLPRVVHTTWDRHRVEYRLFDYDRSFEAFDRGLDWIGAHSREHDVVVSSMAPWVYIRTGRRAVLPPFERDFTTAERQLDGVPGRYVLVDSCGGWSFTRLYTLPLVTTRRDSWDLVYDDPSGGLSIYQRADSIR